MNILRRAVALTFGLLVMSVGIALITRAGLGTSPISAPPFVLSLRGPWTFGAFTFAMLVTLVLIQIALLRRGFHPVQFLQLAAGAVFSYGIDLGMAVTSPLNPSQYWLQWVQMLAGCVVLGIGVAFQVAPRLTYLPGDGTAVVLAKVTRQPFPRTKIAFDSALVVIAVLLSFAFFGELRGVREGTVVAAILVGIVVGRVMPLVMRLLRRLRALPPDELA